MDENPDLGRPPVKAVLFVPDFLDRAAGHVLKGRVGDRIRPPHFPGEENEVGRAQGLDGDARVRIGRQIGVDHGVGDAVADLVGMSFGNRFARKKVVALRHGRALRSQVPSTWTEGFNGRATNPSPLSAFFFVVASSPNPSTSAAGNRPGSALVASFSSSVKGI